MNKKEYQTPSLERVSVEVEGGIATSGTKMWYEQAGQGDFDYVVTEDETWG